MSKSKAYQIKFFCVFIETIIDSQLHMSLVYDYQFFHRLLQLIYSLKEVGRLKYLTICLSEEAPINQKLII